MTDVLDYDFDVSGFEHHCRCYIYFRLNFLRKGMNPIILDINLAI